MPDYTTTGNDYAAVPFNSDEGGTAQYWDAFHLVGIKILRFSASVNSLKVKVLGSIDGTTFPETVVSEFTLTAGSSVVKRIVAYWPYLQVQVKPASSGQNGKLSVQAMGTTISTESIDQSLISDSKLKVFSSEIVQLHANIDFSSSSAQTIIAAPGAGYRIRLTQLILVSGSNPAVNVEVAMKYGSTTVRTLAGASIVLDFPEHDNLGENEALVLQATTADRIVGGVSYYVEAV